MLQLDKCSLILDSNGDDLQIQEIGKHAVSGGHINMT